MIARLFDMPRNHSFFLFGPRQTGKSTLLHRNFSPDISLYINLLDSETYNQYALAPSLFKQHVQNRPPTTTHVIIDEIQRLPSLLNDIHALMESPGAPFFVMSGSSARKLKRAQANLLGGRAWTFNLYPFTHRELGEHFSLQKALERGTLPPVALAYSDRDAQRTLRAYVDTYLKEEIQAEALVRNIGAFLRFMPLAADNNGKVINYTNIARESGVSYNTVKEYYQILQDTLIGFYLYPFARSVRKQLTKHPKFYLFDPGVQRAILRKSTTPIQPKTYEYGDSFEHFFLLEILRLSAYMERDLKMSYYRTSNQAEVDIIVEQPDGRVQAVEIKASANPAPKSLLGLRSFHSICDKAELYCACTTAHPYKIGPVTILPWKNIFAELNLE